MNVDGIQIEQMTAKKIITYYKTIFSLCDENEYSDQKDIYDKMITVCDNIKYDDKTEEITVRVNNNTKLDMKFKLELTTKTYDFGKLKLELSTIIDKMYNIDKKQKFDIIVDKMKKSAWFNIKTVDFWKAYENLPDKEKMGIPLSGEKLHDEYKEFFDGRTWYDILGINTNCWYQTINDCYKALKNIYDIEIEIDDKIYQNASLKDKKIPVNPCEFYKINGFKDVKDAFNKKKSISSMVC